MRKKRFWRLLAILPLVVALAAGFGWIVEHLWNGLMPTLFGLHAVTYWQAWGLMLLCWILFGGLRGRPGRGFDWRHRMRERWEQMTPEEREKFKEGMRRRCAPAEQPAGKPTA
jgi:hypothetical protein